MPLDDLVGVIRTLQRRICAHGAALRENETRTRMVLCDPLLRMLGWDVADPGLVMPEYNVSGRRADYALLGPDVRLVATIEAKKLGESLAAHRMQMLNHSNASGVDYAGLTDGDRWELYEVFKKGQLEDRRILDVSISGMAAHEFALKILLLWRPNLEWGRPVTANVPLFGVGAPVVGEVQPEAPLASGSWVSLADYDPSGGADAPSHIRFPGDEEVEIRGWSGALISAAEWLVATGRLTAANVPVPSSNHGYIVNDRPVHPTGNAFVRHKALSNGLVVFTPGYSASNARRLVCKLLEHCGVRVDAVWLQVGPSSGG